ncbi:MAG: hypothetical protein MOB07_07070 [Acidobacteria bacterium]|nr:hypothetical protein [Acidobacteriota bacterium]
MSTVNQSGSGGQRQTKVELESGEIVITFVPLTTKFSYQFSASLERLNQQWKITSVGLERLTLRR